MNYSLGAIYSQPCQLNQICTTSNFGYVILLGSDGLLRRLDYEASLNGRLPSGQLAKRSPADPSAKVISINKVSWRMITLLITL
jgi:hypothetical protein